MTYKKKTWIEKLADKPGLPKTIPFDPKFPCGKALLKMGAKPGDPVVITQPKDVLEIMKRVPKGRLITLREIAMMLARQHRARYCCTLTCGIHVMIVANAAAEARLLIPWWRTLKMDGGLNPRFPGGPARQKKHLEKEGHRVEKVGRNWFVTGYEQNIWPGT